jgi:hypothetical protein
MPVPEKGWRRCFEDPVRLPDGRKFVTLLDAGEYIAALPRKETQSDHWQAAVEAPLMAAEGRGPLMHARVCSNRRDTHWGRRKLARERL